MHAKFKSASGRRLTRNPPGRSPTRPSAHCDFVPVASTLGISIAHEVSQPLSGIIANAGSIARMLAAEAPDLRIVGEGVRRILRDGNRAAEIVARLRALFGDRSMRSEPVDLNDTVRDVIELLLDDLRANRVSTRIELAAPAPVVDGDRVQIQQVILNLVRNAVDAMSGIEGLPRQLLVATCRDADGGALVSVSDSGVGLTPRDATHLFEAFYTTKPCGMGIGLFVSRSIIARHRGRIWAVSNGGRGATFTFSIPPAREK